MLPCVISTSVNALCMCNTHDTCKKHLAYRLCLYVGPSIAIAMGLAKIIRICFVNSSFVACQTLLSQYIVTHNTTDCGF